MASATLLFFLFLLPCSFLAQNTEILREGEFLTAGDDSNTKVSPSGDFAFGFYRLENKDLFLLAIWYNKIPHKTIVWYPKENGDYPAPRNSKVGLTADRGLVLTDPQGNEIWKSEIRLGEAAFGSMNDTGNFIIKSKADVVQWESFDDPRDTLLPGQILEKDGRKLNSRLRETNFTQGRFEFRLIGNGNGVLNVNNVTANFPYRAYFTTDTVDTTNPSNAGLRIMFNKSGYLYVLRANNKTEPITPPDSVPLPATEYYYRVTLHFDGVLAQYSYPKNSADGNWTVVFRKPDDICQSTTQSGVGPCGFNGICTLTQDFRASCTCPTKFSPLDPDDMNKGCRPDFHTQYCEEGAPLPEDFDFISLPNVNWPYFDYEMYQNYNIEDCENACRQDCFCNVIVFSGQNCWKKKLPLLNGIQDDGDNGKTFIKIRKGDREQSPDNQSASTGKKQDGLILTVSVLLGSSVFFNFILIGLMSFCFFFLYKKKSARVPQADQFNLRCFSYKELVEATNGFKEELGRGSFGIVYKGLIELGNKVPIAVKKLDRVIADSEKEFRTEVEVIGQTHHRNLVKLVGFCDEGQQRLLAYEFVSNGTLSTFLFGDIKLSWVQRTQIANGIARGLVYLHEECSTQIVHCDIKPQNILLDEYYEAKIADFGLAKLLFLDQSQTFTAIRGTKGYVAPEWFRNAPVTVKVDVYSFGVLLLEIICCRRNVNGEEAILTDWAYDCYVEGEIAALVENDEEALNDMSKVKRFVMVALWCIQEDPRLRPTMKMAALMLEGTIKVTTPPRPFAFSAV